MFNQGKTTTLLILHSPIFSTPNSPPPHLLHPNSPSPIFSTPTLTPLSNIVCILVSRSTQTQLLLWPSFKLSPPSCNFSSYLQDLVFASHTHSCYAHITHRVYSLQSSAHTSAELTKISSTVGDDQKTGGSSSNGCISEGEGHVPEDSHRVTEKDRLLSKKSERYGNTDHPASLETVPSSVYVCWTDIPSLLITYTPKVGHSLFHRSHQTQSGIIIYSGSVSTGVTVLFQPEC